MPRTHVVSTMRCTQMVPEVPVTFVPRGSPSGSSRDVVGVRLPAASAYLSVLRSMTAGLAARLDFTLDEIEDLRIAVDEACAMVLPAAVPGAELDVEYELTPDALRVSVTVLTLDGVQPARDTFAWTVLSALAGNVEAYAGPDNRITVSLQKVRGRAGTEAGST
jgi:serine/threonine-protein kinase RsbW